MTWFEELAGFPENSPSQVRENITVAGVTMTSLVNRKTFTCGKLETPSLGELRARVGRGQHRIGKLSVRELVGNVLELHADESNVGCLFQVASQFNLLEMVGPNVTPEQGVGIYENDFTQGPACAIAAGAGTIYRNYFAIVNGQISQSARNQIDCLSDIGEALGNSNGRLWEMRNGYALASRDGLIEISKRLGASTEDELEQLRQRLRIGVQWNTQVTVKDAKPGAFFTAAARTWLLPRLGMSPSTVQWVGILLVSLSTLGFVLAGLGIFGVAGLGAVWRSVAIISACESSLLLLLFWHRWLPIGVLINIGILVALLWAQWPPEALIGS